MKLFLPTLFAVILTSCSSIENINTDILNAGVEGHGMPISLVKDKLAETDLVGSYRFGDGFWNWEIHLEQDKSFGLVWISDTLVEGDDGSVSLETGVDVSGQWSLRGNAVVLNYGEPLVFRMVRVGMKLSLVEPTLRYDYHRVYVKTNAPLTFKNEQ